MSELPQTVRERTEIVLGKGTYLNGGNAVAVQRGLVVGQTLDLLRQLEPDRPEEQLERLREELQRVLPPLGPETVPGLIPNIIVGRIANRLDLMGPAYTVDAACASSLVAVQHAVRDLLAGDCDLALAGGSQVWMPVATLNLFCRLGALSRRQQLRAFDKDADGTLLGEGIGTVVLKRAGDAARDGDRVYAVIRGVGVASDGRGMSVMAPRVEGEELALRRAYSAAGVSTASVGLLEAHGTGTPVGDVVEIDALTKVFGAREGEQARCALGTVKSMIGHTIPAAGVAGVIKTALALHHQVLPPTLGCEQPNPELGLERTPFYINTETRPWIHGGAEPRRAGVNAFGFGGINAHAVLEEWDGVPGERHRPGWDSEVFILEGDSAEQLAEAAAELAGAVKDRPDLAPADLSLTLCRRARPERRRARGWRSWRPRARICSTSSGRRSSGCRAPDCRRIKDHVGDLLRGRAARARGQGRVRVPRRGRAVPEHARRPRACSSPRPAPPSTGSTASTPIIRAATCSATGCSRLPAFSDEERRRTEARLMELDIAVEAVLTANAAVHGVVSRLVPRCDAVLGHSTGEHSAAMAVGALDVETDERLAAFCHGLYASYADAAERHEVPAAVLLAIGADAEAARRIAEEAGGELYLAMDNCPHQAVLVGEADAAARAREIALGAGLMCEVLPYDRAVHTPLFAPFAEDLRATFAGLPVRAARTPLWSCTTAARYPDDPEAIRELLVEHWTRPVRFRETIEALHDDGARVFVEVGPRGNMTSFMQDILRGRPACAVAADVPRRSGTTQLNHLAASLAVHGVELDLGYLFARRRAEQVDWRAPEADAGRGRMTVALSTTWPMLRLSDEALQRLRPVQSEAPARETPPPAGRERRRAGARRDHLPGHPRSPRSPCGSSAACTLRCRRWTRPRRRSARRPPASSDGFLDTMESFLIASERGDGRLPRGRRRAGRCAGARAREDREPGSRGANSSRSASWTRWRTCTCSITRSGAMSRAPTRSCMRSR